MQLSPQFETKYWYATPVSNPVSARVKKMTVHTVGEKRTHASVRWGKGMTPDCLTERSKCWAVSLPICVPGV
jgi:hypothetical protein